MLAKRSKILYKQIMERFPGYISERDRKRKEKQQLKSTVEYNRNALNQKRLQSYNALAKVLPVLRTHAQKEAVPAELPRLMGKSRVVAGWIIEYTHNTPNRSDGVSAGDFFANEYTPHVLTENGLYGPATSVDRGVRAVRFDMRPAVLSPSNAPLNGFDAAKSILPQYFEMAGVNLDQF